MAKRDKQIDGQRNIYRVGNIQEFVLLENERVQK